MTPYSDTIKIFDLKNAPAESPPGLAVQCQPGSVPNHSIELYRLFWIEPKSARLTLDTQPVEVPCGQLLTVSPGETVDFEQDSIVRSLGFHHDFYCIRMKRDEVYCDGIIFNRVTGLPIVAFPERERQVILANLQELSQILAERSPSILHEERLINGLRAVLLHAADCKLRYSQASFDGSEPQLSELVIAFQHLVEETFAKRKDVSFYSDSLGVTPITLNRRVKKELGLTVMQTVKERLAIEARMALRSGDRSIKEIAFDLGFEDPLYFSRFFRKQFGYPPSEFHLS